MFMWLKGKQLVANFLHDTCGATSIEYATIAGLISIVIIGGAQSIGITVNTMFLGRVAGAFTSTPAPTPGPTP